VRVRSRCQSAYGIVCITRHHAERYGLQPLIMLNISNRALWPFLAALVSGTLLAMCFPGLSDTTELVWVWMLPLFPAIWRGQTKRYGFSIGYLAGLAFWLLNLKWLWTVSGVGAIVMAIFLALYFGIWGSLAVSVGNPWRKQKGQQGDDDSSGGATTTGIQQKIAQKQQEQKNPGLFVNALGVSIRSLKFAFINAAAWVALEWLRGWLFTGFTWNGLGVTFHETPILAQSADLVGVAGLAFLPVFMSAVIVQTACRMKAEVASGKLKPRLDFSVAALLLALQFCYGVWRINHVGNWETERVRVLIVQGNIPQDLKWDPVAINHILQTYADTTREAIESLEDENLAQLRASPEGSPVELKQPDLVIWPESAIPTPLYFADNFDGFLLPSETHHLIDEEIRPLGNFTLISGMNEFEADFDGVRATWKESGRLYNSIATVTPEGELESSIKTWHKIHLVIFGEYIPLIDQFPFLVELFKFSSGADFTGNFDAGTSMEPMTVPLKGGSVQLIPSVCFEDTVGRLTRKFVRNNPQLIINVTNDGWFKHSEAARQHMANARFRAIELRRPMIRSANTGVSAIISTTGSLIDPATGKRQVIENAQGNHFVQSSVYGHAYAPKHGPITLYALAGDWFAYLMIALVTVMAVRTKPEQA